MIGPGRVDVVHALVDGISDHACRLWLVDLGRVAVEPLPDHDVYYPGTEDLAPDEMRVVACGTGMPSVRPK